LSKTIQRKVSQIISSAPGEFTVFVKHIESQEEIIAHRADELFPLGSVFKIAVMAAVWERIECGSLNISDTLFLTKDRLYDSFAGIAVGTKITIGELLHLMITKSDNAATDILWLHLGLTAVNDFLCRSGLCSIDVYIPLREYDVLNAGLGDSKYKKMSLKDIALHFQSLTESERSAEIQRLLKSNSELEFNSDSFYGHRTEANEEDRKLFATYMENRGSARGISMLLERIFTGSIISEQACVAILSLLKKTHHRILPMYLPEVTIAHKPGAVYGVRADAGIIYCNSKNHVLVACLMKGINKANIQKADVCIARIAKMVYEYFAP